MTGRISLAVVMLLFVSSAVLAQDGLLPGSLWQYQDFTVGDIATPGMTSVLTLTHGDVEAWAEQKVEIDNENQAPPAGGHHHGSIIFQSPFGNHHGGGGDDCDTTGSQDQDGLISQYSRAEGVCGVIGVTSFLGAEGDQNQVIGASTSGASQLQNLNVGATQALVRQDGGGEGYASNKADLSQDQIGHNAAGTFAEESKLDVTQRAKVDGAANSNAALLTNLAAGTSQFQIVY